MAVTVAAVMRAVRNFFAGDPMAGEFAISGNGLSPAPAAPFVAIKGSRYHDGVYELHDGYLQTDICKEDENFDGLVYPLHPPDDFILLCREIDEYAEKNPAGGKASESFGHYSYTKATNGRGGLMTWQDAYADRLIPYRRMFSEVF